MGTVLNFILGPDRFRKYLASLDVQNHPIGALISELRVDSKMPRCLSEHRLTSYLDCKGASQTKINLAHRLWFSYVQYSHRR
jgi:hypothetical protein